MSDKKPRVDEQLAADAIGVVVELLEPPEWEPNGRDTAPDWRVKLSGGRVADVEVIRCTDEDALWFMESLSPDGPQCAGHIVGAHCTRSGPFKNRQPPGVPSLDTDQLRPWCCNGAINIRAESLDWWQPTSYGTGAHDTLYHRGRSRIENFFNLVRKDGGLDKRSCRVSGVRGHNMVFLAMALVNNVQLADGDPLADPPADDTPRAELSLLCVLPASANNGADAHQTDQTNGSEPALPLRAPP